jgi:protease II
LNGSSTGKKNRKILEIHGDKRIDNYFWLNERENPEVIQYLEEENAYADFIMKDTEQLQEESFEEMKARYKKMTNHYLISLMNTGILFVMKKKNIPFSAENIKV